MDAAGSCYKEKTSWLVNMYDIWTNMADCEDLVDELERELQFGGIVIRSALKTVDAR